MADSFHPYSQWLSLPVELTEPNHYQLLGLREFESDEEAIAIAADRALAKVRGFRPGVHAKAWSQLLDELYGAKTCLLDAASRAEYDRKLRLGRNAPDAGGNPAKADRLPPAAINPDRYPPGMDLSQRGKTNDAAQELDKPSREAIDSKQPSVTQPTTRPGTMPPSAAAAATPVELAVPTVPIAYPVYPQIAGYGPHAGYAASVGYGPQYGYPPVAGYAPLAMPHAAPPSPPPAPPPAAAVPVGHAVPSPFAESLDPMAPVAIPGIIPAAGSNPSVGAAALAGAIPVGTAVSMVAGGMASSDWGQSSGAGPAAGTMAPVGETASVSTSAKSLAMRNARRADQARQNLTFIAGAACIALFLAAGGIYLGMFGDRASNPNATAVALHTPADGASAPAPMGRTLESDLPGGTTRRVASRPTDSTPSAVIGPSVEQPAAVSPNPITPDPTSSNLASSSTVPQLPEMAAPGEASPLTIASPEPMPAPAAPRPESTPAPIPMPTPMPASEPMSPAPAPVPEKPAPASPQQLAALKEALTMGRAALSEQNFDEADKFIAQAAGIAQAEEHRQMVARLREIADYVKQFRAAVEAGAKSLETKDLQVGKSTFVSFVEVLPDRVIVRTAGQNKNYPYADLPPGLAQAIADQQLDGMDPVSRVVKGAYYSVARGDRKTLLERAQTWWEEAQLGGVDTMHLMPFLTDDYESLKSAATSANE